MTDYEISAAYADDAVKGRHYESGLAVNLPLCRKTRLRFFKIHNHFAFEAFLALTMCYHCILAFVEPVQMIWTITSPMPIWMLASGLLCLSVYIADVTLSFCHTQARYVIFPTHYKLYMCIVFLIASDYAIYVFSGRMIFRLLRASLFLVRIRPLRGNALVMLWVMPKFLKFLLIMTLCMGLFAMIGVHLFKKFYEGEDTINGTKEFNPFANIGTATLETFVAMTGGNYPYIMTPVYNELRPLALVYFVTIIMVGQLVLYGILVALIFDIYVDANKKFVKKERFRERQCLIKAFGVMDKDKTGYIDYSQWTAFKIPDVAPSLFSAVCYCIKITWPTLFRFFRQLRPNASTSEVSKRFLKLKDISKKSISTDIGQNRPTQISLVEFFHLLEVLQFATEIKETGDVDRCRRESNKLFKIASTWNESETLYYVSASLNIMFLLPFALVWWDMPESVARALFLTEFVTLTLIFVDVIMRILAVGWSIGMIIHGSTALLATGCIVYISVVGMARQASKGWAALMAHLAVILRLTIFLSGAGSITHWLRRMAPPMCTLLCLIGITFLSYGIFGMECFGHLAQMEHSAELPETLSLCRYGFETLGCSLLTLFQISLGSSWHKVMNYISGEVSSWASFYFVLFYAIMQMIVLNVISAVMVEVTNAISIDEAAAGDRGPTVVEDKVTTSSHKFDMSKASKSVKSALFLQAKNIKGDRFATDNYSSGREKEEQKSLAESLDALKLEIEEIDGDPMESTELDSKEGSIRLSGRKAVGNWTRDIAPDITFLNRDEMKRFQEEMGLRSSAFKYNRVSKRKQHP